jgi:hypothetical protein
MAYVYLLGDSGQENMFKIGMTKGDITKRIKQLQTGNASEIYLVDYFKTKYPFFVEHTLHLQFKNKQQKNEWFLLNLEDITSFKEKCILIEQNAKSLENNPFANKLLK